MITYIESKLLAELKQQSKRSLHDTKKRLPHWKALLIGSLMICVSLISGCQSASRQPLPEAPMVTVDASLMVEPNLTNEMLSVLSE